MELDAINKKILQNYTASSAPTVRDQMKQAKDAYGRPKYADLQDNYISDMLAHYGVTDIEEATAVSQRMGADQIGGALTSNTNVQSRPDDILNQDEMDLLRR